MSDYVIFGDGGMDFCDTYYGAYRTRTFADIFGSVEDLINEFAHFPPMGVWDGGLSQDEVEVIYYLLYARYGNSHISYSDENQFKFALFSIMWQYAPTWKKRMDIQHELRIMSDEELIKGSKAIYNHSFNPSTAPSTSTLEELPTINDQNTTNYKRSKLEAYANLMALLETDVTEEFIDKFRKLFIKVLAFDKPLLYTTEVPD